MLLVSPYVANEMCRLKLITEYRVDGYITDRPGFVREFVGALSATRRTDKDSSAP